MGEELDIEQPAALTQYLRRTGWIDATEEPLLHVLQGGVSNRTVLVQRSNGEAWVLKQALAKLRVAVDWFSSPERIHREATGLRWLIQLAPEGAITPLVFEDHQHHILAMQAVPQPHYNWKTLLLNGQLSHTHIKQFALLLATVHRHAYERRQEIAPFFANRSFFESLRVEPYYTYTATCISEAAPFITALVDETRAQHLTLVHGDYSPKNILVHNGRLILLDHEVIHWGDPAFDLGFSLTHLLSKAHHLPAQREAFMQAACDYWQIYSQALGDLPWREDLEPRAVRHTLACLLARVAGRSPLEYLSADERARQSRVVLRLMGQTLTGIPALAQQFTRKVAEDDTD
jgi:5-methylthioribose kinase